MLRLRHLTLYLALFLSGAAALVYQSAWGRMFQRVFGVGDLAIATVLASFFLGLGLGSAFGGRWAGRIRRPAIAYAALEVAVAIWAALSIFLVPRVHDLYAWMGSGASFETLTLLRLLLALVILLPPTLFMGATLPILIAVVSRRGGHWAASATSLYATNTLGAVLGAGVTGLWLLPEWGTRAAILIAALASSLGAAVVYLGWRSAESGVEDPEPATSGPAPITARVHLATWAAASAGAAAMASEVLWTRLLRMIVQGTTQAFAAMLVNYLFGIAAGSLIARRLIRSGRDPLRTFAATQLLLVLLTGAGMAFSPHLPRLLGLVQRSTELVPHEPLAILATSAMLLMPLALVLGTSVPLAWAMASDSAERAPRYAGRILAANTLGGLVGSLLAGFILVPSIGIERSLLVVACVHGLTSAGVFLFSRPGWRPRLMAAAAPLLVTALVVGLHPGIPLAFLLDAWFDPSRAIIEGPDPTWEEPVVFLEEGRNTTVTVLRRGDNLRLFNDGRPESGFGPENPGFGAELALLGSLPTLLAEERERAMVIGLGAGHSTTTVLGGPWERVDVVELEGAVVHAARLMHEEMERPFPLDDERTHLIVDDARAQLVLSEPATYDAIVSQPSHPWLAGASALYSREFFQESRRALKPGGVLALWVNLFRMDAQHLERVVSTLDSVFEHVAVFVAEESSFIMMASDAELTLNSRVAERLESDTGLADYLEPFDLWSVAELASVQELDVSGARAFGDGAELLVDDKPSLEYGLAALPFESELSLQELDERLATLPWLSAETWDALPEEARALAALWRIDLVYDRPEALNRIRQTLEAVELSSDDAGLLFGALEEAVGETDRALAHYQASGLEEAAYRGDRLRVSEGRFAELIEITRVRADPPSSPDGVLHAALALDDLDAGRWALGLANEAPEAGDPVLVAAVQAWVEGGCPGVSRLMRDMRAPIENEEVAFLGARCSAAEGEFERARRLSDRRAEIRVATSAREFDLARGAYIGGNRTGALPGLRRSLRAHRGNAEAASLLAEAYVDTDRREEALRVLRETRRAAEGRSSAQARVDEAARDLGLEL